MNGKPFDLRVYVDAVEKYLAKEKSVDDIVRETGMSEPTFYNKLREYREKGKIAPPKPKGKKAKRTQKLYAAVKELKREHPNYGCERLARQLRKRGFKLGTTTVIRALADLGLQLPPKRGAATRQL